MDTPQRIRELIEKVGSLYPAERERIEGVAATVFELDHPFAYKAFERALRRVFESSGPTEAARRVDELERARVLATSTGSGLLGSMEARVQPTLRKAAAVFAVIALVAFAVGLVASLLE